MYFQKQQVLIRAVSQEARGTLLYNFGTTKRTVCGNHSVVIQYDSPYVHVSVGQTIHETVYLCCRRNGCLLQSKKASSYDCIICGLMLGIILICAKSNIRQALISVR